VSACNAGNLFHVHLSGQSGNEQLDGNPGQLGAATLAMGHAVDAVITFIGFCSLTISVLLARKQTAD
jgi:hypothetical protein